MERVADRLAAAASAALLGRDVERSRLRGWVDDPDGPSVVFVHGPGGIGKTALVAGALAGPSTMGLDGREVEPTPARLLAHLGRLLGLPQEVPSPAHVAEAAVHHHVTALVFDSYERFPVVDGWVRNQLLPALPASVTAVLVGRNPPNVAWRTSPGWRLLLADLHVGPLTDSDAAALVHRHGLVGDAAARARQFGRGHPLALELAAEALLRHPDLVVTGPPPEVVEELVDVLFDDLDAEARQVVEAASILRRATVPMLAAVLERSEADVERSWRVLRDLPFAVVQPDGVELHAVVQEAAATRLELREPGRTRELRRRAARAAFETVDRAPGWTATADLLHLVQNPVVRDAFLPPAGLQHPVESARQPDLAEVRAIAEQHVGPEESAWMERWWHHHPDGFVVSRGPAGEVQAFSVLVELATVADDLAADPVASIAGADVEARPLRAGGRALLHRQVLTADGGRRPSPELARMIVDLKRTYLEMRPDLQRVYAVAEEHEISARTMRALGFAEVGPVGIDAFVLWALEMPPGSVDEWIAGHIEMETAPGSERVLGEREPPEALATLSAREREVLAALADGSSNQQLAERLFISERTANRHLSNIFTKLGVHNRTAAARIAIEAGLAD